MDFEQRLFYAAQCGHTEAIKDILSMGICIDLRDDVGMTPLMWSSRNGYSETVEFLLENGANVNARDNKGDTALIFSCCYENIKTIEFLLESGADVYMTNENELTALEVASFIGAKRNVKILEEHIQAKEKIKFIDGL